MLLTDALDDWYARNLNALREKPHATEADVSTGLVLPVLQQVLGFGIPEIDAEPASVGGQRLRPDFICGEQGAPAARVIFEVKNLDVNLQQREGNKGWASAPAGQLHRYLEKHARSGEGTWGVLTNGSQWVVVRRGKGRLRAWDFGETRTATTLKDVRALLEGVTQDEPRASRRRRPQLAVPDWLDALASCKSPKGFVDQVAPDASVSEEEGAAFAKLGEHTPEGEMIPAPTHLACLEINLPDGHLAPQDIAERLRGTPLAAGRVVGVAYTTDREGTRLGRGFLHDRNSLLSTALVEPELPGSRAANQFADLAKHVRDASSKAMRDSLSSTPLHREFHEEVSAWFSNGLSELDERQRGNRLRHLIRVMFAWLLQVRGVLPDDALWLPTRKPRGRFTVHRHVEWLFTKVLAEPNDRRSEQKDPWQQSLVKDAPFLNGSLFSKLQPSERVEPIDNDAYLGEGGLFSILGGYSWTLSDRTGYESESAVDPSMLGEMFERLILTVEGKRVEGNNLKMPGGTYYTPQDIADEMAADAVAGRLCTAIPKLDWHAARTVVHPSPETDAWQAWSHATTAKVLDLLDEITVFDPCCGSGVFTLAMLHGLWRAKSRLSQEPLFADDLESIIERQLYAADINPTAVLITRLRLFIALVDARTRHGQPGESAKPLPNLETRCMAANTLSVAPKEQKSFSAGPEWNAAIDDLRAAREAWTGAHYPDEKDYALAEEQRVRKKLRVIGKEWMLADLGWLDADFLSPSSPAAEFDVRKLFPAPDGGWDIVIGNPPYQTPDKPDCARAKRLGYTDVSSNLYLMFIEAALQVSKPQGCVTLVVPHSIVFRLDGAFAETRTLIENAAEDVDIRTYDNRPRPAFPNLPWLKGSDRANDNRQRVTVLSIRTRARAKRRSQRSTIRSSGLIRLTASNRTEAIRSVQRGYAQRRNAVRWTQAPTRALSDLLDAMHGHAPPATAPSGRTKAITFPLTAMYFISCLPEHLGDERHSRHLVPADVYWPWIGLFNSHLFHAYWLMVGDAFHVNAEEYAAVNTPPGWTKENLRRETANLAKRLMRENVRQECRQDHVGAGGKIFPNYKFHKEGTLGPVIIAELDKVLLDAYDLPRNPLIEQMQIIRESSAHRLMGAAQPGPSA